MDPVRGQSESGSSTEHNDDDDDNDDDGDNDGDVDDKCVVLTYQSSYGKIRKICWL